MLPHQRRAEIVQRLRVSGTAAVAELAAALTVSPSTIRRDLTQLGDEVSRVYGGARLAAEVDEPVPFAQVATIDVADKQAVAGRAAELIGEGEVVLLDIGTTVQALAERLRGRRLTVISSSLAVFDVLRDDPQVELILLGGLVRPTHHCLVGNLTEDALRHVRADHAFIGASGLRLEGAVLDTTSIEVPVKRAMISAAERAVLILDRHKFPGSGALKVCDVASFTSVVTNDGADPATLARCAALGVEVVLA